jgi:hypothetical protein
LREHGVEPGGAVIQPVLDRRVAYGLRQLDACRVGHRDVVRLAVGERVKTRIGVADETEPRGMEAGRFQERQDPAPDGGARQAAPHSIREDRDLTGGLSLGDVRDLERGDRPSALLNPDNLAEDDQGRALRCLRQARQLRRGTCSGSREEDE